MIIGQDEMVDSLAERISTSARQLRQLMAAPNVRPQLLEARIIDLADDLQRCANRLREVGHG